MKAGYGWVIFHLHVPILMRLLGGIQLVMGWSGSSNKASLTRQSPWKVCWEGRVSWSFHQGNLRVLRHFRMVAYGSWEFIPKHLGGDCKTYDLVSEFPEHQFHHILLVTQVTGVSPNSRGGELDYLSMAERVKNVWSSLIYYRVHTKTVQTISKRAFSPGWCGSVDWVLACEPKGCWFDSQSGHMPGLQARFSVGAKWEATTHWCFSPSLSPSPPLSLKINKQTNKIK